jgi:pimeloyl-ACP methyl ester carboxylesterase
MSEIELSAGTIEYEDTGGDGPTIVFCHGLLMDGSLWRNVVPALRADYRCVLPVLPLGGHRIPMRPDADLSLRPQVLLVAELLERLDLHDVTLVLSDWGGPLLLPELGRTERVGRLVITSCEAFDNFPPGLPGRVIALAAKLPGGLTLALQQLRLKWFRRLPIAWGWMSKRVPHDVLTAWFAPATKNAAIRRDLHAYCTQLVPKAELVVATERLREFDKPALVAWASEDRIMPPEHGRRLADLLPQGRLVEIEDSYTLIPEDQPARLAEAMRAFLQATDRDAKQTPPVQAAETPTEQPSAASAAQKGTARPGAAA